VRIRDNRTLAAAYLAHPFKDVAQIGGAGHDLVMSVPAVTTKPHPEDVARREQVNRFALGEIKRRHA
jgi:hypothetical protein